MYELLLPLQDHRQPEERLASALVLSQQGEDTDDQEGKPDRAQVEERTVRDPDAADH